MLSWFVQNDITCRLVVGVCKAQILAYNYSCSFKLIESDNEAGLLSPSKGFASSVSLIRHHPQCLIHVM